MPCICCVYTIHILTKVFWYSDYNIWICHVYVAYILYMYWQFVLSGIWLSPRSRYYAPEAATFQRVWTCCRSSEAASSCWVRVLSKPSPVAVSDGAGPTTRRGIHVYDSITRSTPGCGTLDGHSLAWAASQWPRLRRSEGNPGPRLQSADGQLSGLASDLRLVYVWYIHGIYLVYPWYILSDSKSCILSAIK